jgi:hypothetical protein
MRYETCNHTGPAASEGESFEAQFSRTTVGCARVDAPAAIGAEQIISFPEGGETHGTSNGTVVSFAARGLWIWHVCPHT